MRLFRAARTKIFVLFFFYFTNVPPRVLFVWRSGPVRRRRRRCVKVSTRDVVQPRSIIVHAIARLWQQRRFILFPAQIYGDVRRHYGGRTGLSRFYYMATTAHVSCVTCTYV